MRGFYFCKTVSAALKRVSMEHGRKKRTSHTYFLFFPQQLPLYCCSFCACCRFQTATLKPAAFRLVECILGVVWGWYAFILYFKCKFDQINMVTSFPLGTIQFQIEATFYWINKLIHPHPISPPLGKVEWMVEKPEKSRKNVCSPSCSWVTLQKDLSPPDHGHRQHKWAEINFGSGK